MDKKVIYLFLVLLLVESALGATIRGNLYDELLNPITDVIVEVNSTPAQRFLSKESWFLFSLPIGAYNITAAYETEEGIFYAEDIVSVKDEGRYVIDMILEPTFEKKGIDFSRDYIFKENIYVLYSVIIILALIVTILLYFHIQKRKKEEEESVSGELVDIIKMLRKNNGRMTQKEIRKEIPLSEAKISLMVSELEKEGKVEKIKKGRGNIIVLKR